MIQIGGSNDYFQISEKANNQNEYTIDPPQQSSIDPYSILAYSFCTNHSVLITRDGILKALGYSYDFRINDSLPKEEKLQKYTKFRIKDKKGFYYIPISVVCGSSYTLYLISKSKNDENLKLFYSCENSQSSIILNTGNSNPVSLFGGNHSASAIDSEGRILFIPYNISEDMQITPIFLPENDKAVSLAITDDTIFALGFSGRLYRSSTHDRLNFVQIEELNGWPIINISALYNHCLAVSQDGRVFGIGSNAHGKLGFGKSTATVNRFTEISALGFYRIKAAYAGVEYSLFQTTDGKILACGANDCGQLLLSSGKSNDDVYRPVETAITSDASFCIAGFKTSAVFCGIVPPNMPNMTITEGRIIERPMTLYDAQREIAFLKEEVSLLKNQISVLLQRNTNNTS